jgi:hypothetical protein
MKGKRQKKNYTTRSHNVLVMRPQPFELSSPSGHPASVLVMPCPAPIYLRDCPPSVNLCPRCQSDMSRHHGGDGGAA